MSHDIAAQTTDASALDLHTAPHRLKPQFLDQPGLDGVIAVVLRLAMEVSALRDRLATHEALAEKSGAYSRADIDAYEPGQAENDMRRQARDALVAGIMRDLDPGAGTK